ncbi:unnamed protein product [Ceutorhynchus assimilis]|uniref:Protein zwilch n=1 Tax=Ceutorhynchus assimilis TaxID=467358 RepID=A0A9N9MJ43_9CUCU|nr:unnamed protein product [Ceutorhynchus assimilis]
MSCSIPLITITEVRPSYLSWFEENPVNLIHAKLPSVASASDSEVSFKEEPKEEVDDDLDLTGDPLKVDLGHDESLQVFHKETTTQMWYLDEDKHYPLLVKTARHKLNKILKNPDSNQVLSTYIVCNADDSEKTVLLGGNSKDQMACSVHILGHLTQKQVQEIQLSEEEDLKASFEGEIQINEYLDKITYNLYGKSLKNFFHQNASMRYLSTMHGSIDIDVISCKKNSQSKDEDKIKVRLEIVAGHELLKLHFLWLELVELQKLSDILSDATDEENVICEDPLDQDIIYKCIVEFLSSKHLKLESGKEVVDLNNIRQEDLLDGLWRILTRCENVSVLRDSFMFLFEELAAGITRKNLPIKDNCSKISLIIKNISDGKIGVPDISFIDSVELLFELGAQKLKYDFEVILAQFTTRFTNNSNSIQSIWAKFYEHGQEDVKMLRRTRATRGVNHIKPEILDSKVKQLSYLAQLYIASEFIYLLKENVNLMDEGYWHIYGCIEKEYISNCSRIKDFRGIYDSPLVEMSMDLNVRNAPLVLKSLCPSRWIMSMKMGNKSTTETVIYDLCNSPIFPPRIYDYDVPISDSESMVYFVTKMSRSTGLF